MEMLLNCTIDCTCNVIATTGPGDKSTFSALDLEATLLGDMSDVIV